MKLVNFFILAGYAFLVSCSSSESDQNGGVSLDPPSLNNAQPQTFTENTASSTLRFINDGGAELTSCTVSGLPDGLNLVVSSDNASCEISGTPTTVQAAIVYTITASNAAGSHSANVSIEVIASLALPLIDNPDAQRYTQNMSVPTLALINNGGGNLTSCTANSLPAGLNIAISNDATSCEISGTPTTTQPATNHIITASNEAGSDSADINIEVITALAAPLITNPQAQSYTQNNDIGVLSLVNNGGGILTGCSANTLPIGLNIAISDNNSNCEITGTPTTTQSATNHIITASNTAGSDTAVVSIEVIAALASPSITSPLAQSYTQNNTIATLRLINNGGGLLTSCTANTLPSGLNITVSNDNTTCEINGAPTAIQSNTNHIITATNASGSSTAVISIEIVLATPSIANPVAQSYTQGGAITTLRLINNGGGSLTSCTANTLPAGLNVAISNDQTSCEISGSPTAIQSATNHTITASNAAGTDTAVVSIEVAALTAPLISDPVAQIYTVNNTITGLILSNSGGELLTSCTADTLPDGLTVVLSGDKTCLILGTPTSIQAATNHTITASNAAGSDTAVVSIEVISSLNAPLITDPAAQSYIQDNTITTLTLLNNGGGSLTSCTADTLPDGLNIAVSGDSLNCEISGSPTTIQALTNHTITATNAAGSDTAMVSITITENICMGTAPDITISGQATFDRVPLLGTGALDFANISQQPIKGAIVEAICNTVISSTSTDENGNYSLSIPSNTNGVFIRIKAELKKIGTPSWDVAVIDESQALEFIFSMDGSPFKPGTTNSIHNLHAPSGWGGSSYTSTRVAAPFAILDTVYDAMQLVLAEDANAQFPALNVKWSANSTDGTYYLNNEISVLGRTTDSDEFDEHVIAHEWGHYFQDAFSRDDSVGGPHSAGNILDIRVAFSEGFGNAFSAMVTNDPVYKDSQDITMSNGFSFDIESNNCINEGWYNECSVQSIIYDIFDAANDDVLNLGFTPTFTVMTNNIPVTEAVTSLFSFTNPLKNLAGVSASDIDNLLSVQSIDSITDDIGSGMTLNPGVTNQLPVHTTSAFPVSICTTGENGGYNGLGVRRFIQFTSPSSASFTFTATKSSGLTSTDPDMLLYSKGQFIAAGESLVENSETFSANLVSGTVYVLEIYEYASYGQINYNPNAPGAINETCFTINRI